MNLTEASSLLGKKTDTLKGWFSKGCPHVKSGNTFELSIPEIFNWRIDYEKSLLTSTSADDTEGVLPLEIERAMLTKEQRRKLEKENALRDEELVTVAEVQEHNQRAILAARSRLLAIGPKLAPRLPAIKDPAKVREMIDREVYDALKELASGKWRDE